LIFIRENHLCCIASLIKSFISIKFLLSENFAKVHQASFAILIGSNGSCIFHSGVVFVFAQIGVVGLACQVVRA
jgi:hypothetical protein